MDHFAAERALKVSQPESSQADPLNLAVVSSIIGDSIFNNSGEALGHIVDIMFDVSNGKIEFVVIAYGGFLGYNQNYSRVPFSVLSRDGRDGHAFNLNEIKGSLNGYEQYEKHQWRHASHRGTHSRDTDYVDFMSGE
jgi:sporulation protein YlmC with PRC-barrel domain